MKRDLASLNARFGALYRVWLLGVLMLGSMVMVLSSTSINVALPAIMDEFAMGLPLAQWLATGFLAAMTAGLLLAAWAQAKFGSRWTVQVSIGLFVLCSIAALIATEGWQLIVLRILQGASAGMIQPLATVLIFRVYAGGGRGAALGVYGLGLMIAPSIGPTIGGYLVDHFGWTSAFWLPLPVCFVLMAAGHWLLPDERNANAKRLDVRSFILLTVAIFAGLGAISEAQRYAWNDWHVTSLALLTVICARLFFVRTLNSNRPILSLRLWRLAAFRRASWVALALGLGLYGSTYLIPLFLQSIKGYSAGHSGVLLLPAGILLGLASFASGWLCDRIAIVWLLCIGLFLFAVSSVWYGIWGASSGFLWLCIIASIGRIGIGLIMPALSIASLNSLTVDELPYGAGAVTFVRQLGGAFGINLLTVFLDWQYQSLGGDFAAETQAFERTFIVLGLAFMLALWPAWRLRKFPKLKKKAPSATAESS
ncbi:multidrug efflux MFS transporter [Pseudomonas sp. C27(2019)]|uniref:DHA2 family efflux MFS transporter permease subunit n=1 Tax=Pseudomonas sp. C27(2019) TaxID=2604941 RepID=UPI0012439DA7|nr:DHA2 family efflux MFS transporter permease subunit [Pseudomonas sp. C27(2019)]QEY58011.1 multidrug efflux MFS transporter [Pseudomonas sp. C27(2019)]